MMTTQKQVRRAFWEINGADMPMIYRQKTQNDLPTDVRVAFVDFVDQLARGGEITEALARRVTL